MLFRIKHGHIVIRRSYILPYIARKYKRIARNYVVGKILPFSLRPPIQKSSNSIFHNLFHHGYASY